MREDFKILTKQVNEDTGFEEYHMGWKSVRSLYGHVRKNVKNESILWYQK